MKNSCVVFNSIYLQNFLYLNKKKFARFLQIVTHSMSMSSLTKVWKTEIVPLQGRVTEYGLEILNLHSSKSYNIGIAITNFQKLSIKMRLQIKLTLKIKISIFPLFHRRVGFFRHSHQNLEEPKLHSKIFVIPAFSIL